MANYDSLKYYNYDDKYLEKISKKCKCGHTQIINSREKYKTCRYCGEMLFLNKKAEFDYKVKRRYGR